MYTDFLPWLLLISYSVVLSLTQRALKNAGNPASGRPLDCPHITFVNAGAALDAPGLVNVRRSVPQSDGGDGAENHTGTAGYAFFFEHSDCHNTRPISERVISFIMGNI